MAKGFAFKNVKIKPENQVTAEGLVESFNISSTTRTSILFMTKVTVHYNIHVRVEGIEKPLVLKASNNFGWGVSVAKDIEALEGVTGNFPLAIGDTITVAYDRLKPKKCNKIHKDSN